LVKSQDIIDQDCRWTIKEELLDITIGKTQVWNDMVW